MGRINNYSCQKLERGQAYEVNSLHGQLIKPSTPTGTDEQLQQYILNITVTPVLPSNLRNTDDVPSTEGSNRSRQAEDQPRTQQHRENEGRHFD